MVACGDQLPDFFWRVIGGGQAAPRRANVKQQRLNDWITIDIDLPANVGFIGQADRDQ